MSIHFSALASAFNLGPIVLILAVLGLIVLVLSKTTQFVKQQPPQASQVAPAAPAAPHATAVTANSAAKVTPIMLAAPAVSSGECSLFSVDDKTAAMIMAIVADGLNQPLNTLKFVSIKEI